MAGSTFGNIFRITTWGESHGKGIGVVVDGCPSGLSLCEDDIQIYLDKRKPGQGKYTTPRQERDQVQILSGVFEGKTTGTPISLVVMNQDQRSHDYSEIASYYRPGHADYTFDAKYGFRDYRGGGRSSGRETIGRVAAGAIAMKILEQLGIHITAYTKSIGPVAIENIDFTQIENNPLRMPDAKAAKEAQIYLDDCLKKQDSSGGVVACQVTGLPAGLGSPVFEKLDANLAKAMFSIGAVKSFEIGSGKQAAYDLGSHNNDTLSAVKTAPDSEHFSAVFESNHSGGILGGMSNGDTLYMEAGFKPTPSISSLQKTCNKNGENIQISIKGRHDPIIVPRAVVVVESMTALVLTDALFDNMSAQMDHIINFYHTFCK